MEPCGCLSLGRVDVLFSQSSSSQHREVPDEWQGCMSDVCQHVHRQGTARGKTSLQRLPAEISLGDAQVLGTQPRGRKNRIVL